SLAPKLSRDDARVNWKLPATAIDRLIRACTPAPGAWTMLDGATLKLGPVSNVATLETDGPDPGPGEIAVERSRVVVGTGTSAIKLGDVQHEGKRVMPAADWARGLRIGGQVLVLD